MYMKPDLEKRIDETLNSLDGIQRAEPQPFFYTRLIGRLQGEQKNVWEKMGSFLSRPVVVIAGLVIILVMNAFILLQQAPGSPSNGSSNGGLAVEQPVTDNDYILASSSSFEYENLDPQ
jgi:hypothetical protein